MPTFAEVYNNAPPPTVHSTRHNMKSTHPTSTSHIPADAKPIDFRRMSSSKAGMGRTRGTERSSKPEEAPIGSEFAERTRKSSQGGLSDGSNSPPLAAVVSPGSPTTGKKSMFSAFDRRRASSGSPRASYSEEPAVVATNTNTSATTTSVEPVSEDKLEVPPEATRERRSSFTTFLKKVF